MAPWTAFDGRSLRSGGGCSRGHPADGTAAISPTITAAPTCKRRLTERGERVSITSHAPRVEIIAPWSTSTPDELGDCERRKCHHERADDGKSDPAHSHPQVATRSSAAATVMATPMQQTPTATARTTPRPMTLATASISEGITANPRARRLYRRCTSPSWRWRKPRNPWNYQERPFQGYFCGLKVPRDRIELPTRGFSILNLHAPC